MQDEVQCLMRAAMSQLSLSACALSPYSELVRMFVDLAGREEIHVFGGGLAISPEVDDWWLMVNLYSIPKEQLQQFPILAHIINSDSNQQQAADKIDSSIVTGEK